MRISILLAVLSLPALAEEFHRHHVSLLLAAGHGTETSAVIGGDYAYRFNRYVGAAFTFEHTGHELREAVGVGSLTIHPWKQLWIGVGPGWESRPDEPTRKLLRLGGGYAFPLGHGVTLGPDLAVDFLGHDRVYVVGVALGIGFHPVE
ncbi:MAG: hypothetical protein ABI972_02925 [Acidobacteriota bacterium]